MLRDAPRLLLKHDLRVPIHPLENTDPIPCPRPTHDLLPAERPQELGLRVDPDLSPAESSDGVGEEVVSE